MCTSAGHNCSTPRSAAIGWSATSRSCCTAHAARNQHSSPGFKPHRGWLRGGEEGGEGAGGSANARKVQHTEWRLGAQCSTRRDGKCATAASMPASAALPHTVRSASCCNVSHTQLNLSLSSAAQCIPSRSPVMVSIFTFSSMMASVRGPLGWRLSTGSGLPSTCTGARPRGSWVGQAGGGQQPRHVRPWQVQQRRQGAPADAGSAAPCVASSLLATPRCCRRPAPGHPAHLGRVPRRVVLLAAAQELLVAAAGGHVLDAHVDALLDVPPVDLWNKHGCQGVNMQRW